jgi:predicted Zn-dependent protease
MPRIFFAVAVSGCLYIASPSQAGLYSMAEPIRGPAESGAEIAPMRSSLFQNELALLTNIPNEQPPNKDAKERRQRYLDRRADLERQNRLGTLTVEQKINLSECLIRFRQYDAAITLLAPLARQERNNFLVYANLGTAYQLTGQLPEALEALKLAKLSWPREWKGWTSQQLQWFGRVETYHTKLVLRRLSEAEHAGRQLDISKLGVDDIFGVQFVGENAQYEAGQMAAAERAKLPPDALAVVQQLLIWMPDDTRLYWLMGELLNGEGDIKGAKEVFDQCSWTRRFGADQLKKHLQIVREALPNAGTTSEDASDVLAKVEDGSQPAGNAGADEPASLLPDRQHLIIVGGLAALVVAALAYLQILEIRRRRQGKSSASKGN